MYAKKCVVLEIKKCDFISKRVERASDGTVGIGF